MNQHLCRQQGSDVWKPIPSVLVPELYCGIVHKEKAVPDLRYDKLPSTGIHVHIYIFMLTSACKFFHQVDHDSRKGLLQNCCLQRTPMIPLAEKGPCGSLPAGMPLVLKRLHSYVSAAHKAAVSPASCSWLLGKPEVGPVL